MGKKENPSEETDRKQRIKGGKLIKCHFTGANFAASSLGDTPADRMALTLFIQFKLPKSGVCTPPQEPHSTQSPTDN